MSEAKRYEGEIKVGMVFENVRGLYAGQRSTVATVDGGVIKWTSGQWDHTETVRRGDYMRPVFGAPAEQAEPICPTCKLTKNGRGAINCSNGFHCGPMKDGVLIKQPAVPMRSGPGVEPYPMVTGPNVKPSAGMVVRMKIRHAKGISEYDRRLEESDWDSSGGIRCTWADGDAGTCSAYRDTWDNGDDVIVSGPQQPAPALCGYPIGSDETPCALPRGHARNVRHAAPGTRHWQCTGPCCWCKGSPCGTKFGSVPPGWGTTYNLVAGEGNGLKFCSAACRDIRERELAAQPAPAHVCRRVDRCGKFTGVPWAPGVPAYFINGDRSRPFCSVDCMNARLIAKAATEQPAHVCKGRPCGDEASLVARERRVRGDAWGHGFGPYRAADESARAFCSHACRDAWKPGVKPADEAAALSALSAKKLPDVVEPPSPPSAAPWKCSNEKCTTPTAGPYHGRFDCNRCVACADRITTGLQANVDAKGRPQPEPLPTFHRFDIPVPLAPLGWSHPPEWKPGDDSSIWSE